MVSDAKMAAKLSGLLASLSEHHSVMMHRFFLLSHFVLCPKATVMFVFQVYYQECEMFGLVAKMLIAKDPSLERPIQSSLQENLRDIGKRCVEAMEKFIVEYDSRELLH